MLQATTSWPHVFNCNFLIKPNFVSELFTPTNKYSDSQTVIRAVIEQRECARYIVANAGTKFLKCKRTTDQKKDRLQWLETNLFLDADNMAEENPAKTFLTGVVQHIRAEIEVLERKIKDTKGCFNLLRRENPPPITIYSNPGLYNQLFWDAKQPDEKTQ